MSMSQLRVLVVGASIAGPTTAYWFAKAGAKVTVIERFPSLRTNGQGIDIGTAGVTVMRKIPGMEAAVRAKTTSLTGMSFVRNDGSRIATLRATGDPDAQSLVSEYEIFRGDLSRILYDVTKDQRDIEYVFNEQVVGIYQHDSGEDGPVKVEFLNDKATEEYDLVVACDGATSRTRGIGFGDVRDHIHPTDCWAAYYSIPGDVLEGSKDGLAYTAVGGKFMAIGPDPANVTRVTLMAIQSGDKGIDVATSFRQAQKEGDASLRSFVAKHFGNSGWISDTLVKGLYESDDFYANEVLQVKIPYLSKGRFVTVGDAGYAPGFTGTGTTMALTGAYILAGEVGCRHDSDVMAGLAGYEARMRPIVNEMQKVPPFVPGVMAPQTAWGIYIRNIIFRIIANIAGSRILGFVQRTFSSAFAKSAQYPLPDYDWKR